MLRRYGLQQTRPFRALKVWMTLRHLGHDGYRLLIARDIAVAGAPRSEPSTGPRRLRGPRARAVRRLLPAPARRDGSGPAGLCRPGLAWTTRLAWTTTLAWTGTTRPC